VLRTYSIDFRVEHRQGIEFFLAARRHVVRNVKVFHILIGDLLWRILAAVNMVAMAVYIHSVYAVFVFKRQAGHLVVGLLKAASMVKTLLVIQADAGPHHWPLHMVYSKTGIEQLETHALTPGPRTSSLGLNAPGWACLSVRLARWRFPIVHAEVIL
jgi:anti-sigma-K factor RskA